MHDVVEQVVDDGELFEIAPDHAGNIIGELEKPSSEHMSNLQTYE